MEELLVSEKKDPTDVKRKRVNFRSSVFCYLALICVLVCLIDGFIILRLCDRSVIEEKLYTYNFPYRDAWTTFNEGTPASIDHRGSIWPGAGFSVYQNITQNSADFTQNYHNLHVRPLGFDLFILAHRNGLICFRSGFDKKATKIDDQVYNIGQIRQFIMLTMPTQQNPSAKYIILTDTTFVPFTATMKSEGTTITVSYVFGRDYGLGGMFPHVDTLNEELLCFTLFKQGKLLTSVLKWEGEGDQAKLTDYTEVPLDLGYVIVRWVEVAGFSSKHFIIVVAGTREGQPVENMYLSARLITISDDKKLSAGPWVERSHIVTGSFFTVDNFDATHALLLYSTRTHGLAGTVMNLLATSTGYEVSFGSTLTFLQRNAVDESSYLLRMISRNTFALVYRDVASGWVVVRTGTLTPSLDLVLTSPPIVTDATRNYRPGQEMIFDLQGTLFGNAFILVECRSGHMTSQTVVHRGESRARAIGVAKKINKGIVTLQYRGVTTIRGYADFTVGYTYYTDTAGKLHRGNPAGHDGYESGVSTINTTKDLILGTNSIVGVAVTPSKLMLML